jgi:hypothetical protein
MTDTMYPFVGGPLDGRHLATSGARIFIAPIMRPVEVVYSTSVYSHFDELTFNETRYERFDDLYWWEGLVADAWADCDVTDEALALGGALIRREVQRMLRRELIEMAGDKELGRVVWRVVPSSRVGIRTFRAFVGPRAVKRGLQVRLSRAADALEAALG